MHGQSAAVLDEDQAMRWLTDRLAAEMAGTTSRQNVGMMVREAWQHFAHAPVRRFIPILVERRVRDALPQAPNSAIEGLMALCPRDRDNAQ